MTETDISTKTQMVIGFPGSGKSTFLAALWHLVSSQEVETVLSFKQYFGNDEYLNEITQKWIEYEQLGRTPVGELFDAAMRLSNVESGETVDISFADLAGETFWEQWNGRTCTREYAELVAKSCGAILFLHPDKKYCPTPISATSLAKEALSAVVVREEVEDREKEAIEWSPDKAAMQTAIVEMLQFIARLKSEPKFRVAVVISAWDLLGKNSGKPEEWLAKEIPLLSQFLKANYCSMPSRVFGVSAQGDELIKARDDAHKIHQASERISITGPDVGKHDLTGIIKWIMVHSDD